jgi:hypothetical protein
MLMEAEKETIRPRRLLFWRNFSILFLLHYLCLCTLEFSFQTPHRKNDLHNKTLKKCSTAVKPQRIGKIKKNQQPEIFTEAEKIPQHNSDGLKHNKNNNVFFFCSARGRR